MERSSHPFLDELAAGAKGIALDLRRGPFAQVSVFPRGCLLEVPEGGERVHVRVSPTRLDLDPAQAALLAEDVRHEATLEMRAAHAELGPRDDDPMRRPSYDPVVEMELGHVDGAPALRVLRRLRHLRGNETVLHELFLPLPAGTLTLQVTAHARMTGLREAMVMLKALGPSRKLPEAFPSRAEYDRPDHDTRIDPLGRARRALEAFLEAYELTATRPLPVEIAGERLLEEAGCAIAPPPRHLPAKLPVSPTLSMFTRGALSGGYRLFEVWRLPDRLQPGPGAETRLAELARASNRAWADEGAYIDASAPRVLRPFGGRPQVADQVHMRAGGRPSVVAQRWLLDTDGVVFRVAASGPPSLADALERAVEDTLPTWRRLDEVGPPPGPSGVFRS